jgi:hypothetical protein
MAKITRYDPVVDSFGEPEMARALYGDYVTWYDYSDLADELERLRACVRVLYEEI